MQLFILFLVTLSGTQIKEISPKNFLIVWNVGQGQWVTGVTPEYCIHFDAGGEFFPQKKIQLNCYNKPNQFYISHGDWDHISAFKKLNLKLILGDACLAARPKLLNSKKKISLLRGWPDCEIELAKKIVRKYIPKSDKNSNESSHVFSYKGIIIPGDSPASLEKSWGALPWVTQAKILLLGHHGSKTSTSNELLANLSQIKFAISSSRWARYRHPNPEVVARLKKFKIPLLKTEDWGNIWYSLK